MGMLEDFCAAAKQLEQSFAQLIAPFGWKLTVRPEAPGPVNETAFHFRCCLLVRDEDSPWAGQVFDQTFTLLLPVWVTYRGDGTKDLPLRWAQQLMVQTLGFMHNPPMPPAPALDWRPTGAVPEDFYAA